MGCDNVRIQVLAYLPTGFGNKTESVIGAPLVGNGEHVASQKARQPDLPAGLLKGFPQGGFYQAFAFFYMTCRLIEDNGAIAPLLNHQESAFFFNQSGNRNMGVVQHKNYPAVGIVNQRRRLLPAEILLAVRCECLGGVVRARGKWTCSMRYAPGARPSKVQRPIL